jgi:copper chaperone
MKEFMISGLSCGQCVVNVKKSLYNVTGVTDVQIDLKSQRARVSGNFDEKAAMAAIKEAGYGPILF